MHMKKIIIGLLSIILLMGIGYTIFRSNKAIQLEDIASTIHILSDSDTLFKDLDVTVTREDQMEANELKAIIVTINRDDDFIYNGTYYILHSSSTITYQPYCHLQDLTAGTKPLYRDDHQELYLVEDTSHEYLIGNISYDNYDVYFLSDDISFADDLEDRGQYIIQDIAYWFMNK